MSPDDSSAWPDYRAVRRLHFLAGLFCIPFVIVLSITGSIYLFKTEIEALIERPYDGRPTEGRPAAASEWVRAAVASVPGSSLHSFEIPDRPDASARVVVARDGGARRVYVDTRSLKALGDVDENGRLMRRMFRLHGELGMGNAGSAIVELAASWTIVMIITGLYLWWPRKGSGLGGVLYPRFGRDRRIVWRDLHSVVGFWISSLAIILLLTGLPWAKFWGDYLKRVRALTGTAVVRQDWTNGATPPVGAGTTRADGEHHGGATPTPAPASPTTGRRGRRAARSGPVDLAQLDRVVNAVIPLGLDAPVVVEPPSAGSSLWSVKSMTPNRPRRVDLEVEGKDGSIRSRKNFSDRHVIDRIIGTGIAAHEGRLFGPANQLLGLLTAAGLVLLGVSSVVMWGRRREPGTLGVPGPGTFPRFSLAFAATVLALSVYLPLFGASLLVVLVLDSLARRLLAMLGGRSRAA